jgi:hypothetical protein
MQPFSLSNIEHSLEIPMDAVIIILLCLDGKHKEEAKIA